MSNYYFDNAATSYPKPKCVRDAVARSLIKYGGNPGRSGHKLSLDSAKAVYDAREILSEFYKLDDPSRIAFSLNATASINTAVLGLPIESGTILVSDIEHNAVLRAVVEKCRRSTAKYKVFKSFANDADATYSSFVSSFCGDTVAVVINAASNVDGRILPIERICRYCRDKSVYCIIDASQLSPHKEINAAKLEADFVCCAGHKGFFSPMGCGFAVIGNNYARFAPLTYGGNGVNSADVFVGDEIPERFECGTLPVPAIVGLKYGVEYINGIGVAELEGKVSFLAEYIFDRLRQIKGLCVYHEVGGCPVISFTARNKSCEEIAYELSKRNVSVRAGLHCAPLAHYSIGTLDTGTVRVSPYYFNSLSDAEYLIKSVYELTK